jgi:hypothetical protein
LALIGRAFCEAGVGATGYRGHYGGKEGNEHHTAAAHMDLTGMGAHAGRRVEISGPDRGDVHAWPTCTQEKRPAQAGRPL